MLAKICVGFEMNRKIFNFVFVSTEGVISLYIGGGELWRREGFI